MLKMEIGDGVTVNVFLFSCLLAIASTALFHEQQSSSNNTCLYEGAYYGVGESWRGNGCSAVHCSRGPAQDQVTVETQTCGVVALDTTSNCQLVYNDTEPYPDCCTPNVQCTP